MGKRILFIVSTFIFNILLFLILKSIFIAVHFSLGGGISLGDALDALYHGLPLDMSTSGYLTILPALLIIVSLWIIPSFIKKILNAYWLIVSIILSAIFVADMGIYPYWGFHFDASIFLYLQNPKEALASASTLELIVGTAAFIILSASIYMAARKLLLSQLDSYPQNRERKVGRAAIVLLLVAGSLFLPIRGGIGTSTMNVGYAYFSENMFLNHAAINPHFNLLYSLSKSEDFGKQYQFYPKEKAEETFKALTQHNADSTLFILKEKRPNIILVILESFSAAAAYDSIVAPNFVKLSKEGINFSNFYANSFRTDRGLVSVLSGYPAHPTVALMKYPRKTQTLPSIPKALVESGYQSSFYYGGDVNFASMKSYIVGACATDHVYGDSSFPLKTRITKWGAPDEFLFNRVFDDINSGKYKEPFISTMLTLSSHEPFDVPEKILDDPFLNSMHYTDQQIGLFIDKLKASKYWDNSLVVFLADHCMQSFPAEAKNYEPVRFHIPMVWAGGAVAEAKEIANLGSQNDLAATLLGQLQIDYNDFLFSNNLLSPSENKFAFYSYFNGFSMIDDTGSFIYDNDAKKTLKQEGNNLEEKAKSFFQTMYTDLGSR